mgnify:FL=1
MKYLISIKKKIKENEGYRNKAYLDLLGFATIGYGHLIRKNEKYLLERKHSKKSLSTIFEDDFNKALKSYLQFYKYKNHEQGIKGVYIEMIFQLGINNQRKFIKMHKHIDKKNYFMAAFEMKNSLWYKQTPKRVDLLINMLLKKKYEKTR